VTAACSGEHDGAPRAPVVSVATSLTPALRDIAGDLESSQAGPALELNSAASGVLVRQILRGAPADVFLSAAPEHVDELERAGRIATGTRTAIASNRLVVVVAPGVDPPDAPHDLGQPRFARIAIGNPRTAPVGRYARQCLERTGLWETVETRVVYGENARQTLEYVARGDADVGIVYRTDTRLVGERVTTAFELPDELHDPIVYVAAVVDGADGSELGVELLRHLSSPAGRAGLAAHGFLPPP
jgi:molybdate transport system substrate-binding protein